MKELLIELQKYIEVDNIINDLYYILNNEINKKLTINEIENFINLLNSYLIKIKNLQQVSLRKKNKILNILNEIIIYYNEMLMNKICEQI